jgi:molybdopterin molybdotransferase
MAPDAAGHAEHAHEPGSGERPGRMPGHDDVASMVPFEEARERLLDSIQPLAPIELPLQEAFGCVLAEDVVAEFDMPPFSSSGMDGFAVRSKDVAGATPGSPVELRVVGRAQIGRRPDATVGWGEAVRIATGAPVPAGADCIVPIEDSEPGEDAVRVLHPVEEGRHIRPAGEDVKADEVLAPAGRRIGGAEMGLLAASGRAQAPCHPRPRVVVISTGDELVEPWLPTAFGQVRDANSFTISGGLKEAGATPYLAGIVRDDIEQLQDAIVGQMVQADAFISSGGVSVGERDVVKQAFSGRGDVDFYRVAMQPGMPQAFGHIEGKPYFGLPGNPVSVFVSFEVFIRPALMKMMGRRRREWFRPEVTAMMETDVSGPRDKTVFARVRVARRREGWTATSTGGRGSNLLGTVAKANGLAVIPPGTEKVHRGEEAQVMVFRALEA